MLKSLDQKRIGLSANPSIVIPTEFTSYTPSCGVEKQLHLESRANCL
jgi:hypothetical protein